MNKKTLIALIVGTALSTGAAFADIPNYSNAGTISTKAGQKAGQISTKAGQKAGQAGQKVSLAGQKAGQAATKAGQKALSFGTTY